IAPGVALDAHGGGREQYLLEAIRELRKRCCRAGIHGCPLLERDLAEAGVERLEPGRRPALSEYLADILARERYVARRRSVVAAGERASDAARAEAELTVR